MRKISGIIKSTIIGGIVFLVPIVILVAIVGKAFEIMKALATPLANKIPIDSIGGFATANLITIAIIVLFCFLAGLVRESLWPKGLCNQWNPGCCPRYLFMSSLIDHFEGFGKGSNKLLRHKL